MRSLGVVGARSLAHRRGRSLTTGAGIGLGVAILFGVLLSNAAVDRAFTDLVDRYREPWADVVARPVGAHDAQAPLAVADDLARLPGVAATSPSLGHGGRVVGAAPAGGPAPPGPDFANVHLIGVDTARWSALTRGGYEIAEGRLHHAGAPEVVLGSRPPPQWGAVVGRDLVVATSTGEHRLRVVGRFADRPGSGGDGERVTGHVHLPIEVLWAMQGEQGVVDAVVVDLDDGTDVGGWLQANRAAAPAGLSLERMGAGDAAFGPVLDAVQGGLTFVAAIALFVGAFLIYLTLSTAVVERTRLYGTLRAVGATRRQVRRLVLAEALALGTASTVVGLVLGYGIARVLVGVVAGLVDVERPGVRPSAGALAVAVAAGVVTTLVSSLVPARRAARLAPVAAMRGEHRAETTLGRTWQVGLALALTGGLLSRLLPGIEGMAVAVLLLLAGAVLLVPAVLRPAARLLGSLTRRLEPGVGEVAVMHLVKERSRSAYTLALVMVVFAMVLSLAAANTTMARALARTVETQMGADVRVWGGAFLDRPTVDAVAAIPGVEAVTEVHQGHTAASPPDDPAGSGRMRLELAIVDPATYFGIAGFAWSDGADDAARAGFERGGAVVLPERTAEDLGVRRGGTVALDTTGGSRPFEVVGVYAGFGNPQPAFVGIADGRAHFGAADPTGLGVDVADDVAPEQVRQAILGSPPLARAGLFVTTVGEAKREAAAELNGFFRVFYAVLLVAGLVGMLGLTNTLAMSVLQRVREIGVLRALGVRRGQLRSMVLVESATLVLVALVLALPLGSGLALLFTTTVNGLLGFSAPYAYPWTWLPAMGVAALVVGALAASGPARRAARLQVVTALSYE